MKRHKLKTLNPNFTAVKSGFKHFELRLNDRDFKVGDILELHELLPNGLLSGAVVEREVSYILTGGEYGLDERSVIMSLKPAKIEVLHIPKDYTKITVKPNNVHVSLDFNGTDKVQSGTFCCLQCATQNVMNPDCLTILNAIQNSLQTCANCGYDNFFDIQPLNLGNEK